MLPHSGNRVKHKNMMRLKSKNTLLLYIMYANQRHYIHT